MNTDYRPRKYVSKKAPFCGQINVGLYRSRGLEKTILPVKTMGWNSAVFYECPIPSGPMLLFNIINELQKMAIFISQGLDYEMQHYLCASVFICGSNLQNSSTHKKLESCFYE